MLKEILHVGESDNGLRLDVFISNQIDDISRSRAKTLIEEKCVLVDGKFASKAGQSIKSGSVVEVSYEENQDIDAVAEDIPLNIIYEDSDIAVINKAKGMVTHPSAGWENGTLVNALLYHIKDLSGINGQNRPGIVHRLDKDTSGLMVIAKNDFAHKSLAAQISDKTAFRIYTAILDGVLKEDNGQIEANIGRSLKDRKKMAVVKDGRYALTYFKVLERFDKYTLTEFKLSTGRTHQIRVHAAFIHHPVTGDLVYGGSLSFKQTSQLLHAFKLELNHPRTNERLTFTAPLPDYFEDILTKLRCK